VPRKLISSGSYLEPEIGFSRAVRVGQFVAVAGTAPIAATGGTAAPGDVYLQTMRCIEIIGKAVAEADGTMASNHPDADHVDRHFQLARCSSGAWRGLS
jgi:enamine deaminase RidA (YjgF/YER057c/UK114 family)